MNLIIRRAWYTYLNMTLVAGVPDDTASIFPHPTLGARGHIRCPSRYIARGLVLTPPIAVLNRGITEEPVVKLASERKHLTNLIKMVAYQAESDLLRLVAPNYRRAGDGGRTLLQSALASAADLKVTQRELRVTLAAQSSPHARAIAAPCEELNRKESLFAGPLLRLRYAMQETS